MHDIRKSKNCFVSRIGATSIAREYKEYTIATHLAADGQSYPGKWAMPRLEVLEDSQKEEGVATPSLCFNIYVIFFQYQVLNYDSTCFLP